jgi:hypothetical protein
LSTKKVGNFRDDQDVFAERVGHRFHRDRGNCQLKAEPVSNVQERICVGPMSKIVLSWFVAALGLLVGFIAFARFGMAWPPFGDNDPGWLLRRIEFVAGALLGLVFIVASIVAFRNPKRAGLTLLIAMPFAVFCLAYPSAGYLVWHSDGSGWFEPPEPLSAIGLTTLFFLPIFAGIAALRLSSR